ncbi:hypothetical protein FXO38_22602 [Capsicum annuum]|uniref:Uncharacterized protein n=1 Tax=Capsicum annuum TaxID=4072 RepID=A0A2G2Z1E7_CAPAN|nr:hypothetical protein FXO37_24495 [Capsicum annuum]KAF3639534.1 hypothetical protein FXO38_22602 [Capsicum annuum]PHT75803.1 hypothetical protein T459_19325 [Capsicum annuum]
MGGLRSLADLRYPSRLVSGSGRDNIKLEELKKAAQKSKALSDELNTADRSISSAEFNAIIHHNVGLKFYGLFIALSLRPKPITFNEPMKNL